MLYAHHRSEVLLFPCTYILITYTVTKFILVAIVLKLKIYDLNNNKDRRENLTSAKVAPVLLSA